MTSTLYYLFEVSLTSSNFNISVIVSTILLLFINVFFFYLFDKLKITEKIKYDNELLKSQSEYYVKLEENICNSYNRIRIVKHDLKNNLLFLKSKTYENTSESLQSISKTIDYLIGEVLSEDFKEYTKNQRLNRLLNYKLTDIEKSNIDFEIESNISEQANIDESYLYVIIGNAIDNAIENFNTLMSCQKIIKILIHNDDNNLFIKISNPYNKKITLKNDLPITAKEDTLMHGLGLSSVKNIVKSKNGHFKIKTDNYIFSLEIILFDEFN